ncbi:MAG: hypothetical protein FWH11_03065 [Micrococcales bacterium]|nr:hypothetical protein [Micrococcales bacterium]
MSLRSLNLANDHQRDAMVGFDNAPVATRVTMVLPDGTPPLRCKYLKTTARLDRLVADAGDLVALGQALVDGDPEIDVEQIGRPLTNTHRIYLTADGDIAYRVTLQQVIHRPDGTEKERRDATKAPSNVALEDHPVRWSGRLFDKREALRRFVFTRAYQVRHTSGLTYDFLYAMAKQLQDADALMFVGSGPKGTGPLVLTTGGEPYRGFLEGRVDADRYALVLHLTNLELKALPTEEEGA